MLLDENGKKFIHDYGGCGELAFCKIYGLIWVPTVNAPKSEPDVPPYWQIRTTLNVRFGQLPIRRGDPLNHRYVLMTCDWETKTFHCHGWIQGSAAMNSDWLIPANSKGPSCHMVPRECLNKFNDKTRPTRPQIEEAY